MNPDNYEYKVHNPKGDCNCLWIEIWLWIAVRGDVGVDAEGTIAHNVSEKSPEGYS